jgi:thiol-disulfide isomerase/thioredoxin
MIRLIQITLILLVTLPVNANPPDMHLVNISGTDEPMSNYIGKGQWVIVNVWSPTCSACVIELPQIKKLIARNPDVPVLGVTLDFPSFTYGKIDIVLDFLKHTPLDYPLFLADMEQTSQLIGRWLVGIPSISIFHPDGRPLVTWPGVVEVDEIEKFIKNYKENVDPLSVEFD